MARAITDTELLKRSLQATGTPTERWIGRLDEATAAVCPRCDAYALGIEAETAAPFYSEQIAAFLTVHDHDWWNDDPTHCDIRDWPDFGCMTISEAALQGALAHVRTNGKARDAVASNLAPDALAAVAGIPKGRRRAETWRVQLERLKHRAGEAVSEDELEAAVALLLAVVANHPWVRTADTDADGRSAATTATASARASRRKPSGRGAVVPESEQFFWNCHVAATLIDHDGIPRNTATKACVLYAVRKASICLIGKDGVRFATPGACAQRTAAGVPWQKAGLVKEHVVPVSLIRERVVAQLDATRNDPALRPSFGLEDEAGLTAAAAALFRAHPRAWEVGKVVRDMTLLAWITREEEKRFDEKARHGGISLRKRMPMGWRGEDVFARYTACELELVEVSAKA